MPVQGLTSDMERALAEERSHTGQFTQRTEVSMQQLAGNLAKAMQQVLASLIVNL